MHPALFKRKGRAIRITPAMIVWFLILANWNGGVIAIEQPSRAACIAERDRVHQATSSVAEFCVSGSGSAPKIGYSGWHTAEAARLDRKNTK